MLHYFATPETLSSKLFITGLMLILCIIVITVVLLLVRARKIEPWAFKNRNTFWPQKRAGRKARRNKRYDKNGFRPLNQEELLGGYNSEEEEEEELDDDEEDGIVDIRNFSAMSSLHARPPTIPIKQNGSTASNSHIDT